MRYLIIALSMLLCPAISVHAQISVDVGLPGINIGINVPAYPELAPMPGYPVYYAPRANSNYFFYDGLYWVYQEDNWYASSWYNGPWQLVGPEDVPLAVLRIPVRYYREPPVYFRGWRDDAPPHWGEILCIRTSAVELSHKISRLNLLRGEHHAHGSDVHDG